MEIDEMKINKKEDDNLLPCPFCGTKPVIVVEDDEGNVHLDDEYEKDPWSGIWYALKHPCVQECIMSDYEGILEYSRDLGNTAFKTRKDAIDFWNSTIKKVKTV